MLNNLSDKVVLLTGVGGGIGETFLKYLLGKPKVLITSSRSSESSIEERVQSSKDFFHYSLDLTSEINALELFNNISENIGKLDILINTIGGSLFTSKIENFSLEKFEAVIKLNLSSAFLLTREAIKLMKKNFMGGNIIHLVSSSAKKISMNKAPYGIAKAGLVKLIQYSAAENAVHNIKINGITPTYTLTPRHEKNILEKMKNKNKSKDEIIKEIVNSQLIKKILRSEDLIPVLDLLMTTDVITGQIINCTLGEVISY